MEVTSEQKMHSKVQITLEKLILIIYKKKKSNCFRKET